MKKKCCSFPKCKKPVMARALCPGHYMQQRVGAELRPLRDQIKRVPTTRVTVHVEEARATALRASLPRGKSLSAHLSGLLVHALQ